MPTTVLWLRRDLRLHDLPALSAAHEAAAGGGVLPLYVLDETLLSGAGGPRRRALGAALRRAQADYDGGLVVRRGDPRDVVPQVAREVGAGSVHVSGETTPYGRARDEAVHTLLWESLGIRLVPTGTPYAVSPGRLATAAGTPFRVFTPFARAWRAHGAPGPDHPPAGLRWHRGPESCDDPLGGALHDAREGQREDAAEDPLRRWAGFLDDALADYDATRDRPDLDGTSRLSEHLKFGAVHPRTLLAGIAAHEAGRTRGAARFVDELAWREFYADVLTHRPDSAWRDLRPSAMAWDDPRTDERARHRWEAWCTGRTGYPFVDAGMRQLLTTGWMHNRLRMVTASFLVKDLHIAWQHGARFFLQHLRDGDLASNNHGWQWAAGTGTDAAPFFRIFNPVTQGARFDPDGDYVRAHVAELAGLPGRSVHEPWRSPDASRGGYPSPIVDHATERAEALARYEAAKA